MGTGVLSDLQNRVKGRESCSWWVRFPHTPEKTLQAVIAHLAKLLLPTIAIRTFSGYTMCRKGAVAQLGARLNGIEKVRGSNPLSSTLL